MAQPPRPPGPPPQPRPPLPQLNRRSQRRLYDTQPRSEPEPGRFRMSSARVTWCLFFLYLVSLAVTVQNSAIDSAATGDFNLTCPFENIDLGSVNNRGHVCSACRKPN